MNIKQDFLKVVVIIATTPATSGDRELIITVVDIVLIIDMDTPECYTNIQIIDKEGQLVVCTG